MTGGAARRPAAASVLPGASPAGGARVPWRGLSGGKRREGRRGLGQDHMGQEGLALQPLSFCTALCPGSEWPHTLLLYLRPWQLGFQHLLLRPRIPARTVCHDLSGAAGAALRTVCALSHGPWWPEHMEWHPGTHPPA